MELDEQPKLIIIRQVNQNYCFKVIKRIKKAPKNEKNLINGEAIGTCIITCKKRQINQYRHK